MTDRLSLLQRACSVFSAVAPSNASIRIALATSASAPGAAFVAASHSNVAESDPSSDKQLPPPKTQVEPNSARGTTRSVGEQLSFGGILGYATGYSIRKAGKAAMFFVGAEVVILQYMAYRQWIVVDWGRMGHDLSPKFSKTTWDGFVDILVYKMPFSLAFSGGLLAGLRIPSGK